MHAGFPLMALLPDCRLYINVRDATKYPYGTRGSERLSIPIKVRLVMAVALLGVAMGSFVFYTALFFHFMDTQPTAPQPANGLVYPLNNHGWVCYLSANQITQLSIPVYISVGSFVTFAILVSDKAVRALSVERTVNRLLSRIMVAALLISILILWVCSHSLASALVAKGYVIRT